MSSSRAKAVLYAMHPGIGLRAVAVVALAAVFSIAVPAAHAATWSSTDATTTEAITNAPPQRDKPDDASTHRPRAGSARRKKASEHDKAQTRESEQTGAIGSETVVTTTLPGTGRSANTVTIGTPQIMLQSSGAPGGAPGAVPCVPVHFAMGSPPQGESSKVDSWYCPQVESGHHLAPR